eukprot:symbB.v1.2.041143.t1/scaffold7865.1/size8950/1
MHYPHLQYPDGQTVAFGHYEDPLPDQLATKLPTDLQNVPYYCSGYRLLHWSPRLSQGSNRLPPDDVVTILKVAATLSFYVARQVSSSLSSADDISMQDGPHTLRINQSALLTPSAVLKHQAKQITNARTVAWTLKFTLPTPAEEGTTRRFSAVREGTAPVEHRPLKRRCDMLVLSITSMPPFSPTLTFSPCLITLLNMALQKMKRHWIPP